jgi:hypothetical protein
LARVLHSPLVFIEEAAVDGAAPDRLLGRVGVGVVEAAAAGAGGCDRIVFRGN